MEQTKENLRQWGRRTTADNKIPEESVGEQFNPEQEVAFSTKKEEGGTIWNEQVSMEVLCGEEKAKTWEIPSSCYLFSLWHRRQGHCLDRVWSGEEVGRSQTWKEY